MPRKKAQPITTPEAVVDEDATVKDLILDLIARMGRVEEKLDALEMQIPDDEAITEIVQSSIEESDIYEVKRVFDNLDFYLRSKLGD